MTIDRRTLRAQFRSLRSAIPAESRSAFNRDITRALERYDALQRAQTIAAYLATDGEVNLGNWLTGAWKLGKHLALPRLHPHGTAHRSMEFRAYGPDTALEANRHGIDEPVDSPVVTDFDAVLVPLVAFDRSGTRLGMGGGYYDTYFAQSDTTLIGVAFSCQASPDLLPRADWDVRLDVIVTEIGIEEF